MYYALRVAAFCAVHHPARAWHERSMGAGYPERYGPQRWRHQPDVFLTLGGVLWHRTPGCHPRRRCGAQRFRLSLGAGRRRLGARRGRLGTDADINLCGNYALDQHAICRSGKEIVRPVLC